MEAHGQTAYRRFHAMSDEDIAERRQRILLAHLDSRVIGWRREGEAIHSHDDVNIFGLNTHRLCEPVYEDNGSTP